MTTRGMQRVFVFDDPIDHIPATVAPYRATTDWALHPSTHDRRGGHVRLFSSLCIIYLIAAGSTSYQINNAVRARGSSEA